MFLFMAGLQMSLTITPRHSVCVFVGGGGGGDDISIHRKGTQ